MRDRGSLVSRTSSQPQDRNQAQGATRRNVRDIFSKTRRHEQEVAEHGGRANDSNVFPSLRAFAERKQAGTGGNVLVLLDWASEPFHSAAPRVPSRAFHADDLAVFSLAQSRAASRAGGSNGRCTLS